MKISIYGRQRRHRHLISPTRHGCTHGTLCNAIFTSLIGYEIDVIDTLRFNNDADFLYRLATALGMRPNHKYWCKFTWRTNGINKTATSDRLDLRWQLGFQWHRRGIELVFKSLDCFTMGPFFCCHIYICCLKLHQADNMIEVFFNLFFVCVLGGGGALSSNVFTICAVYWSLGRRGYFGVSNVVPVFSWKNVQMFFLFVFQLKKHFYRHRILEKWEIIHRTWAKYSTIQSLNAKTNLDIIWTLCLNATKKRKM